MKSGKSKLHSAILLALTAMPALALANPGTVNPALAGLSTTELPRVTNAVDANAVSVIGKSHLGLLDQRAAIGSLPDSAPMNHIHLILKRSALRQAALDELIAAQHDPHSPKFHQWLTPEEFGEHFGVADADIAKVTSWLTAQGFTVNGVYPSKMEIDFSGTAGQVKSAFHTQEKLYKLQNVSHIANATDISLPSALKDVVIGPSGLNDFRPHPALVNRQAQFNSATNKFKVLGAIKSGTPQSGGPPLFAPPQAVPFSNGARGLVPYDLAKMYGVDKLHAAGITGQGVTIAVVEDDSMVPADWTNFVSQFDLGSYKGTFAQIQPQAFIPGVKRSNCLDPTQGGTHPQDDGETLLDAEWSTAMAPSAHIEVASCSDFASTNFFGGVFTAATNLINGNKRPDIISASYGYGEGFTDSASKSAIDQMWAQADVEGISVFVSSGDSGSNPSFNGGIINSVGIDANAFGTSPHDTVVGGTDTADVLDGTTSKYFSTKLNSVYGSALSYVPEIPWNQSCGNSVAATDLGYANVPAFCKAQLQADPEGFTVQSEAGSGGPSSVDAKPAWQTLVHGAAKDTSRDVPDVSLFAGSFNGDTWVITCTSAYPCAPGWPGLIAISGGTSLASPMFAGIQALIDQGLAADGLPKDQGNAAPVLYALAKQEYGGATGAPPSSLATCNADNGATGTSACVFHNVTRGGISTQCIQQLPDIATPDCRFYGVIANLYGFYGPFQVGLTSTSATTYGPKTAAYLSQPGWSFAAGLGSVDASNLLAAWEAYATGN
jgi:subtilase family serine protease